MEKRVLLFMLVLVGLFAGSCSQRLVVVKREGNFYEMDGKNQVDSSVYNFVTPYRDSLNLIMNDVLATSDARLVRPVCGKASTKDQVALVNFIADAWNEIGIRVYEKEFGITPDFFMSTCGSVRGSLPKGKVTLGNVYELMPFDNHFTVVKLTPKMMGALLNHLSTTDNNPVANLTMRVVKGKARDVMIGGKKYDPQRTYHVIVSNYHAGGGDNMPFFKEATESFPSALLFRDALIQYMNELTAAGKTIKPNYEERIKR